MKNVYELAAEFRRKLLARDDAARRELMYAYRHALRSIEEEITRVAVQVVNDKGTRSTFLEQRRLYDLQRQVKEAITNLASRAAVLTTNNQQWAVTAARHEAVTLLEAQALKFTDSTRLEISGAFDQFPADVIAQLVGVSHGNPIHEVFTALAKDMGKITAERLKQSLIRGVALGESPDRVTRRIIREVNAQNGNTERPPVVVRRLHSAVRNETFRAYREATRLTYRQNSDVVEKWRWVSRQSPLTCVICWARDGKTFPLSKPFASHPNCRCVSVPVLDEDAEDYMTGTERFERLEVGVQRSILGDRAYAAYARGQVELEDFVEVTLSKKWGPGLTRRSLDELLKRKAA